MTIDSGKDEALEVRNKRISEIICQLIRKGDHIKIDEIADGMFVSRSTVDRLIPEVREELGKYNLRLLARPKYGLFVDGREKDKRICYSHHHEITNLNESSQLKQISDILTEVTDSHGIQMNDISFYNLINHCSIAIDRIRKGNFVTNDDIDINVDDENLVQCADEITRRFERSFNISIPANESQYILMHLLGKGDIIDSNIIKDDIWDIVHTIFDEINQKFMLNLSGDTEVVTALAMHIQPLLYRSKFKIEQNNPLLKKIKSDMNEGYDLAVVAKDVIRRKTGIIINDDEVGYIALHLSLALKRLSRYEKSKKIIVVCTTGQGTARLIKYRLMSQFSFDEDDITMVPLYRLNRVDFADYSCILSTVPISQQYPVPHFLVSFENDISFSPSFSSFMSYGEKSMGLDPKLVFTHLKLESAEEVLRFMCSKIQNHYGMKEDFTDSVLKREELASTEVGNLLAVPHAFEYGYDHVILSVAVLDRKIRWKNTNVQLIILSVYPLDKDNSVINEQIAELAGDPEKINEICQHQEYEVIRKCLLGELK